MKYNINYSPLIISNKLNIFTFWEPKQNMPYYLELCLKLVIQKIIYLRR